jgi:hypothetical protein
MISASLDFTTGLNSDPVATPRLLASDHGDWNKGGSSLLSSVRFLADMRAVLAEAHPDLIDSNTGASPQSAVLPPIPAASVANLTIDES